MKSKPLLLLTLLTACALNRAPMDQRYAAHESQVNTDYARMVQESKRLWVEGMAQAKELRKDMIKVDAKGAPIPPVFDSFAQRFIDCSGDGDCTQKASED